jgi:hypothetical protein
MCTERHVGAKSSPCGGLWIFLRILRSEKVRHFCTGTEKSYFHFFSAKKVPNLPKPSQPQTSRQPPQVNHHRPKQSLSEHHSTNYIRPLLLSSESNSYNTQWPIFFLQASRALSARYVRNKFSSKKRESSPFFVLTDGMAVGFALRTDVSIDDQSILSLFLYFFKF